MATTVAMSGKSGTITGAGACGATEIKNWAATIVTDALEATSMASSGWKEVILGLRSITGTFQCIGVSPLAAAITQTVPASIALKTSDTGITVSGKCIVNSAEVTSSVDGVVTYNCSFTGSETFTAE
jgi:hypothetical protein